MRKRKRKRERENEKENSQHDVCIRRDTANFFPGWLKFFKRINNDETWVLKIAFAFSVPLLSFSHSTNCSQVIIIIIVAPLSSPFYDALIAVLITLPALGSIALPFKMVSSSLFCIGKSYSLQISGHTSSYKYVIMWPRWCL